MSPYRTNTAPPVDAWDGTYAVGVVYVGDSNLVVASNGKVYNRRTGERVKMRPLKELVVKP